MLGLTKTGDSPPGGRSNEHRGDAAESAMRNAIEQQYLPLIRTIEAEIIPRLLLAHKGDVGVDPADARGEIPTPEHVIEFAGLALAQSTTAAAGYIEAMVDQGYLLETLYLDLLAPAARHLGELWEQDLCDFVDVTMALGRVQHVIREFSPIFREARQQRPDARRILLAPAPGDQHSMGLMMVREFFVRAGWEVVGGPGVPSQDVATQLASEWFDCVGISAGSDFRFEGLANWLAGLRAASKNRAVSVMLGGPHFVQHPELAALLGADATAADARDAVRQAEMLAAR